MPLLKNIKPVRCLHAARCVDVREDAPINMLGGKTNRPNPLNTRHVNRTERSKSKSVAFVGMTDAFRIGRKFGPLSGAGGGGRRDACKHASYYIKSRRQIKRRRRYCTCKNTSRPCTIILSPNYLRGLPKSPGVPSQIYWSRDALRPEIFPRTATATTVR